MENCFPQFKIFLPEGIKVLVHGIVTVLENDVTRLIYVREMSFLSVRRLWFGASVFQDIVCGRRHNLRSE